MTDMRILLLATALLSTSGFAQGPGQSPPTETQVAPAGIEAWIRQLGSDKYRERLDAENKLRAQGKAAKKALEAAAADERDSEVQWRAKRLLRQLKEPKKAGDKGKADKPGLVERRLMRGGRSDEQGPDVRRRAADSGVDDLLSEFDRLLLQLRQEHGIDVPPLDGEFRSPWDSMTKLRSHIGPKTSPFGSHGSSVQITPDGVRVEVRETNEDGESDTKVYEAPDMEAFKKKYPDVLKKAGATTFDFKGLGLPGLLPEVQWDSGRIELDKLAPGFDRKMLTPRVVPFEKGFRPPVVGQPTPPGAADLVPAKGRRLGVAIQDIPGVLRDYLELAPGLGLMVESVQEDTLAASLRLRAGDIVVSINGQKIGSPSDVRDALTPIKKGEDVKVAFIRRGERREASTKKVDTAQPERKELEPKKKR